MKRILAVGSLIKRFATLIACAHLVSASASFAESSDKDWPWVGGDHRGQYYSELDQIDTGNVSELGLAWYMDMPLDGGLQATPLAIDGVLYFTSAWSRVYAVDAKSGELKWAFDPEVDRSTEPCCGPNNRGVAYDQGRLFLGALDGRLLALDAQTGKLIWSTQTIDVPPTLEGSSPFYTITGAPVVAGGKVIIGNGGGEFAIRGFVTAYHIESGEKLWRFYTVPGDPSKPFENPIHEMTSKTWHGEWWKLGGGGTAYDALAYDPELNLFYVGVGNSSPYNPLIRTDGKGDNLFLASIVALNADTGEYVWHYQTTPGESWDYTATQNIVLAELDVDGERRKVLMQAPKNGFFYVLDRVTGEFLSAEAYEKVTWASGIDEEGRPIVTEEAKYWLQEDAVQLYPSQGGAHSWHRMAFNPNAGLVYIPAVQVPGTFHPQPEEEFEILARGRNTGLLYGGRVGTANPEIKAGMNSLLSESLIAWDPVEQAPRWTIEHGSLLNGGVLTTAGDLVFQGSSSDGLVAYNAFSGQKLWQFDVQTAIGAAPMTYRLDGEQYIAVLASRTGILNRFAGRAVDKTLVNRPRLLVFKLGADSALPEPAKDLRHLPDWSEIALKPESVDHGAYLFAKFCASCHGIDAVGNSITPDLRYSPVVENQALFNEVVLNGLFAARGMLSFKAVLGEDDTRALRDYIIFENQESRKYGDVTRVGR